MPPAMMVRFPKALQPGDLIAVTAPSSGVQGAALARLDLVLAHLRARGYRVVEGECLRDEHRDASAPKQQRAEELQRFLFDPEVAAIIPPWGGELASELLELLDFDRLRSAVPTWLLGYSDTSTLQLPLTLLTGWATAHGPNLMDLAPTQTDPLTTGTLSVLERGLDRPVEQASSLRFQTQGTAFAERPDAPLNLTEATRWRRLDGSDEPIGCTGRLIGGCLDTLAWLAGTRFGDVPSFIRAHRGDGVVLFLENAEMSPPGLVRALLALRRHGWLDGLAGLLIGRNAGPVPTDATRLNDTDAWRAVLGDPPFPVLADVDIGHRPPQFTLVNGACARVHFEDGRGSIVQACERAALP